MTMPRNTLTSAPRSFAALASTAIDDQLNVLNEPRIGWQRTRAQTMRLQKQQRYRKLIAATVLLPLAYPKPKADEVAA